MSTVKITELPDISTLDTNEANTVFVVVDVDSDTTGIITLSTLYSNVNSYITSNAASANSVINTRITANVATLRGEIDANAASANSVINTRIDANIAAANLFTQAAFDLANTSVQETGGTITGDLIVTGNVTSNYGMEIKNSSMPGNGIFLLITGAAGGAYGIPSNPGYTITTVSPDGEGNRIVAESYASKASGYASFIGRRARGTAASPTAAQAGDIIMRLGGNAYGTTKFSQFADARIEFIANQNVTDTEKGTRIEFWATANNTNTAVNIATMTGDQVDFTGYVSPTKGFVYVPSLLVGNQTAITVDFTANSMIKANIVSDMTVSFTNYVPGKIVEMWITNTSGSNRTVTHGCSAVNSTVNSTTVTIPATSSGYFKYFSIQSDLANTFVAITSA